jgi:hypothetical protein
VKSFVVALEVSGYEKAIDYIEKVDEEYRNQHVKKD